MTSLASPFTALGFTVRRRDLHVRADVNYARLKPTVNDLLRRARYQMIPLEELVSHVQYGTSSRAVPEQVGTPMLRMVNLQNGDWDLSDLKYTTLREDEQTQYLLAKGDICFTRTNGSKDLVGKCAVFREDGPWIFASYLIRVRVNNASEYLPEFLARFLNSSVGRVQIDRLSRQALMTNINAEEIRQLLVPLPPIGVQQAMIDDLGYHWRQLQAGIEKMHSLLAAGNQEIAERLSLKLVESEPVLGYAALRSAMAAGSRLNAEFFHPERIRAIRMIRSSATPAKRLDELARFVRDHVPAPSPGDFYIGLANVERDTGELVAGMEEDLPEGACLRFQPGDVLFAKLRPYLNKVHLAERKGVCSPEFFVLRPRSGIRPEYLAAMLRSDFVLAQTRHMAGGNTHPRLTTSDVHEMYIPLPEQAVQHQIAETEADNRSSARQVRETAAADWDDAKRRFGDALFDLTPSA